MEEYAKNFSILNEKNVRKLEDEVGFIRDALEDNDYADIMASAQVIKQYAELVLRDATRVYVDTGEDS